MNNTTVIGIDLAKDVFQLCGLSQTRKVQFNQAVRRNKLLNTLLCYPGTLLAMEACCTSHYWARRFRRHGFEVVLVPAQLVKGFSRGNKTDAKDALAIAEAALRPDYHPVPVKTLEQQDYQALLRYRARQKELSVSASNQARGLLAEYGVILPRSGAAFRRRVPEILEDGDNGLTPVSRATIHALYQEYLQCLERVAEQDKALKQIIREHPLLSQLIRLRGVGPVTAVALYASVGKGEQFANARQLAAWIGLVPRQHGTGGRVRLGAISKRGNRYLRELLVHGARAVMQWAREKLDRLSDWVRQLAERRGKHKTIVAIANKTARMVWVLLNRGIANVPGHYLKAA